MDDAEQQREKDNAYRAIGRWIVLFAALMARMRNASLGYFGDGTLRRHTELELLVGEAMPQAIANTFFGLCRLVADYDDNEQAVANALEKKVGEVIKQRTHIAHGDWFIGQLTADSPEGALHVRDPILRRVLPGSKERKDVPIKTQQLSVEELDAQCVRLGELLDLVVEFGDLALGGLIVVGEDGEMRDATGMLRVGDVLVIEGAQRARDERAQLASFAAAPKPTRRFTPAGRSRIERLCHAPRPCREPRSRPEVLPIPGRIAQRRD
jgi:hypothetical protein